MVRAGHQQLLDRLLPMLVQRDVAWYRTGFNAGLGFAGEQFMSMFDDYDGQAAKRPKKTAALNGTQPSHDSSSSLESLEGASGKSAW